MSKAWTVERRRWWFAASALCLIVGLQAAAVPPEFFADPGVCFMDCGNAGESCCCRKLAGLEAVDPHAPEAALDGRWTSSEEACRELCDAYAGKAPGDSASFLAETRHQSTPSASSDYAALSGALFKRLGHSDPSTLPRPPPAATRS